MSVFKSKEFIEKLKWLTTLPTRYYSGANWSNFENGAFNMDCVVSIKSILWGFTGDKNKARGGAIYGSNGVADFTTWGGLEHCSDVSTDFSNLTAGEYLCMSNTSHAGIYLGNGKVYECTSAWEHKCMISDIDNQGNRSYKGQRNPYKWTHHGKLNYIDYNDQIEEPKQPKQPKQPKKSNEEVAQDVIAGKYGNYPERKEKLEAEGYVYQDVQDIVNRLVAPKIEELKVGNKVQIIGNGNGASDGSSNIAYGIGWEREILKIYEDRAYPYQVGNNTGTTGFYKKESLKKI